MRHPAANRPRKVPRQERSRSTVEALLEATARVLIREGYEGATTIRIAGESGYGVGSLYDYFPNKDALVAALIERHAEEMVGLVGSVVIFETLTPALVRILRSALPLSSSPTTPKTVA